MTAVDIEKLNQLISRTDISGNDKRIMIIPNYVHDGYCIGIYKDTKLIDQYVGATIQSLVKKINSEMIMK